MIWVFAGVLALSFLLAFAAQAWRAPHWRTRLILVSAAIPGAILCAIGLVATLISWGAGHELETLALLFVFFFVCWVVGLWGAILGSELASFVSRKRWAIALLAVAATIALLFALFSWAGWSADPGRIVPTSFYPIGA